MKFMVILKATKESEAGTMPTPEAIEAGTQFNEALGSDGWLLAAEGLWPSSAGARIAFEKNGTTVTDGPFAETSELIGAYWIVKANSLEDVIARFKHAPATSGGTIEIRRAFDVADFGDEFSPEMKERWNKV
jgi:hypothetical protein